MKKIIRIVFKTVYTIIPYCYDNFALLFIFFYFFMLSLELFVYFGIFEFDEKSELLKNDLPKFKFKIILMTLAMHLL